MGDEFIEFLRRRAESDHMWPAKLETWVKGMSDLGICRTRMHQALTDAGSPVDGPVLDVGCGFGNLLLCLSEVFGDVRGIDLIQERTEWAQRRCPTAQVVCGSAAELPWPDETFAMVFCTDVFEHIDLELQRASAREIWRVLKPGGIGFIAVPSRLQVFDEHNFIFFGTWMPDPLRKFVSEKVHGSYTHCYEHTKTGWRRLFAESGLGVRIQPVKMRRAKFLTSRFHLFLHKPQMRIRKNADVG